MQNTQMERAMHNSRRDTETRRERQKRCQNETKTENQKEKRQIATQREQRRQGRKKTDSDTNRGRRGKRKGWLEPRSAAAAEKASEGTHSPRNVSGPPICGPATREGKHQYHHLSSASKNKNRKASARGTNRAKLKRTAYGRMRGHKRAHACRQTKPES